MRLKMSDKSLFAVLLRSSWWVSFAIALAVGLAVRLFVPEEYVVPALSICFPFLVIGSVGAWRQSRLPRASQVTVTVETVSAMSWRDFSALMEAAFQRDGFVVTRIDGAADFRLDKAGRVTLVCSKRWKAASHGVEPLRELHSLYEKMDAATAIYVALGGLTEKAARFARENNIRIIGDMDLTRLLCLPKGKKVSS